MKEKLLSLVRATAYPGIQLFPNPLSRNITKDACHTKKQRYSQGCSGKGKMVEMLVKILDGFPKQRNDLRMHLEEKDAKCTFSQHIHSCMLKLQFGEEEEKAYRTIKLYGIIERKQTHLVRIFHSP